MRIVIFILLVLFNINNLFADSYILKIKKAHSYKEFVKYYKKIDKKNNTFSQGKIIANNINSFEPVKKDISIYSGNYFSSILPDPLLNEQTWLKIIDGLDLINLSTGKGVVVGLLDSGVEMEHEDLKNQIIKYYNVAEDNDDVSDSYGHGTGVAGIIAAIANNGNGIRGIAPDVKLVVAKINSGSSPTFDDYSVAKAIYYLVDNGAQIINMSIQMSTSSEVIEDAIDYAKEKGVILVSASGNFGSDYQAYPASNSYVLGVGSVDDEFNITSFTSYDNDIFIFAPGKEILTTYINNSYAQETGTSFSAPMVTGIIADLLALNPYLTYNDIKNILTKSTDKTTSDNLFKVLDFDNSIYGSGVKISTNQDSYNTGDILTLSLILPPLSTSFDFYFGIISPDNSIAILTVDDVSIKWQLVSSDNILPSLSNIETLTDYTQINIFGDNNSLFTPLHLPDSMLSGDYKICACYAKNSIALGYIKCKTVKINSK